MLKGQAVKCPKCGWSLVKKIYNKGIVWYCPNCRQREVI